MEIIVFRLTADHGHFRKPWTNNSPQTFSLPPKPAMMGICAAMAGVQRDAFKDAIEDYCSGLAYGLLLNAPLRKKVISTYQLNLDNFKHASGGDDTRPISSPRPSEYIVQFDATIVIGLKDEENQEAKKLFNSLYEALESGCHTFEPTMGHVNCFASAALVRRVEAKRSSGEFSTRGFSLNPPKEGDDIMVERLPIMRKKGMPFFDILSKEVYLSEEGERIKSEGEHFRFDGESFCVV